MCLSMYDLVCDRCREECDKLFTPEVINSKDYDKKKEKELREEWFKRLCPQCKFILKEEGFIE